MAVRRRNNRRRNQKSRYRYRAKKRALKPTMTRVRISGGIPDTTFVKLKYTILGQFGGDTVASTIVRGNGPFDPEYAIGGNQPLQYGLFAGLYAKQMCTACKIVATFLPIATATQSNSMIAILPTKSPNEITPLNIWQGQPYMHSKMFTGQQAQMPMTIKHYQTSKRMFGVNKLDETEHASLTGQLPPQQWYFVVQQQPIDPLIQVESQWRIQLTYYIKFFEREQLSNG